MQIDVADSKLFLRFDPSQAVQQSVFNTIAQAVREVQGVTAVLFPPERQHEIVAEYEPGNRVVDGLRELARRLRTGEVSLRQPGRDMPLESTSDASDYRIVPRLVYEGDVPADAETLPGNSRMQALVIEPSDAIREEELADMPRLGSWTQFGWGVLTCVSFGMTVVGILVPGIPTVPFVISTVYCANYSSPSLRRSIMQTPIVGTLLQHWDEHHSIDRLEKERMLWLVLVFMLISFLVMPATPMMITTTVLMSALSAGLIWWLPEPEDVEPQLNTMALVPA